MKELLLLGLSGMFAACNTNPELPYCKKDNILVPLYNAQETLVSDETIKIGDYGFRIKSFDRDKDKNVDLAEVIVVTKSGMIISLIDDRDLDGEVDQIYVDTISVHPLTKELVPERPDGKYDIIIHKAGIREMFKDDTGQEPTEKDMEIEMFIHDYYLPSYLSK